MLQHNNWCVYVCSVWRYVPDCSPWAPWRRSE